MYLLNASSHLTGSTVRSNMIFFFFSQNLKHLTSFISFFFLYLILFLIYFIIFSYNFVYLIFSKFVSYYIFFLFDQWMKYLFSYLSSIKRSLHLFPESFKSSQVS